MDTISAKDCLTAHGVKPSVQRLAVMDYLLRHRTHPTVDEIYNALVGDIPTLSKATVYNTLRLLTETGAAQQLTINEHCTHYDAEVSPHAHFLCRRCGKLVDIPLRRENLLRAAEIPEGYTVDVSELYFKGLCPDCSGKANNE